MAALASLRCRIFRLAAQTDLLHRLGCNSRQHHPRATTVTVFSGGSRIGAFSQPKVFLDSIFFVDANRDLVIVLQSAWPEAWNTDLENRALSLIGALADYVFLGE